MSYARDPVFAAIEATRTPRFEALLARAWEEWSARSGWRVTASPAYTNYKPFERARLGFTARLSLPGGHSSPAAAHLVLETAAEGSRDLESRATVSTHGPPAFAVAPWNLLGWTIPNAPELTELALLLDPEALGDRVGRHLDLGADPPAVHLLRCVPRKRSVLRIERADGTGALFAKLVRQPEAEAVATAFEAVDRAVRAGGLRFRAPRVLHRDRDLNTVFMTRVPGLPLTAAMRRAEPEPFRAVGAALASLHGAELRPTAIWTVDHQLDDLIRHLAGMARALPSLAPRIVSLVDRLIERRPEERDRAPIHGNLFGDQILWDGERVGIVDWDRLSDGDPHYDLGRLVAHLLYETGLAGAESEAAGSCVGALLDAYRAGATRGLDRRRLAWHTAVELLLRAKISALRPLPPGWADHCRHAVAACERLVGGSSPALSLPALAAARSPAP